MHARICLLASAILAATTLNALADPLTAADIETTLPGAVTSGVNAYGNPYTVRFLEGGRIEGVAGASDEYRDGGSWWLEGDALCRRWDTWLEGQTNCFSVTVADGTITWLDTASGTTTVEDFTPAQ